MTMEELHVILEELANNYRPIFHSEADFQFELACAIKKKYKDKAAIRMEKPYTKDGKKIEVDIIVNFNGETNIGIELKYITKEYSCPSSKNQNDCKEEVFSLKEHAATNLSRYDFYVDINRLEYLKETNCIDYGYVIFLTNNSSYQKGTSGMAKQFTMSCKHTIEPKTYNWDYPTWQNDDTGAKKEKSVGKRRTDGIDIKGKYSCEWKRYGQNHGFEYLCLKVFLDTSNQTR
jgi:hypothetical protein